MKLLGLLAGMSWVSGLQYERRINQMVAHELGGVASANLLVRSFDFAEIESLQRAGDWDRLGHLLASAAKDLQGAGCEAIAMCTNTMHLVAPEVESAIEVPLIHIGDVVAHEIRDAELTTVGLLGTAFTMEKPFLTERISSLSRAKVLIPEVSGRDLIHRIIYEELVLGKFEVTSKEAVLSVCKGLRDQGCQGVIAACTEIEELINEDDIEAIGMKFFPSAELHAKHLSAFLLG